MYVYAQEIGRAVVCSEVKTFFLGVDMRNLVSYLKKKKKGEKWKRFMNMVTGEQAKLRKSITGHWWTGIREKAAWEFPDQFIQDLVQNPFPACRRISCLLFQ